MQTFSDSFGAVSAELVSLARARRVEQRGGLHIAITSANSGEGKTFIATQLAEQAAVLDYGLQVLLVDANLGAPALSAIYNSKQSGGLAEMLRREAFNLENLLAPVHGNLRVLGAGSSPEPLLLYRESDFLALKKQLARYDLVVFDCNCIQSRGNSVIRNIDRVILVVDATATPRRDAQAALATLRDCVGDRVWGVILNKRTG